MTNLTNQDDGRTPSRIGLHADSSDRMLVARALVEGATLVSRDAGLHVYGAPVLW